MSQRCQDGGMELLPRGGRIGPVPTNCSLQKCLEEAQDGPGKGSECHASSSVRPTPASWNFLASPAGPPWILEPMQLQWKPLRSFLWPRSDPPRVPSRCVAVRALGEITIPSEPRFSLPQPSLGQDQSFSALRKSLWLVAM